MCVQFPARTWGLFAEDLSRVLGLKLLAVQLGVVAAKSQKLFVCAALDDLAAAYHVERRCAMRNEVRFSSSVEIAC